MVFRIPKQNFVRVRRLLSLISSLGSNPSSIEEEGGGEGEGEKPPMLPLEALSPPNYLESFEAMKNGARSFAIVDLSQSSRMLPPACPHKLRRLRRRPPSAHPRQV